jgi:hypothetical protein
MSIAARDRDIVREARRVLDAATDIQLRRTDEDPEEIG